MAVMPSIEELVKSIEGRLRELGDEIASLEDARSALIAMRSAPAPERKPKPRQTSRRGRPRTARTALSAEAAESMLAPSDGLTTTALADQAGADRAQVLALLRELEAAGRVRRTGQRRTTRWHVITDEDRIRERAAELAARQV
jgi:hypothetical protein